MHCRVIEGEGWVNRFLWKSARRFIDGRFIAGTPSVPKSGWKLDDHSIFPQLVETPLRNTLGRRMDANGTYVVLRGMCSL